MKSKKSRSKTTTQPTNKTQAKRKKGPQARMSRAERILSDPAWRLANLYSIKTEDRGHCIAFDPRPEQKQVIQHLLEKPDVPLYIIKARRLGMSTAIGLTMADAAAWEGGLQCSLIDQTQADAQRKMSEIMRYALLNVRPDLQAELRFPKLNDTELQVYNLNPLAIQAKSPGGAKRGLEEAASRIYAGRNARGGTNNFLWISEWGPIAATDPKRSQEIRTGALPSARRGRRVIETTWYGGKAGDLWDVVKPILERDPNAPGELLFFPWHRDPACISLHGLVDADLEAYFKDLADRLGRTFSQEQKRWYASVKLEQGIFVKREYPSTLDEAMTAPIEGTIYGDEITRLQAEGAMGAHHKVDHSTLVHTFWDVGSPQTTVTWYLQFVGENIRVIDLDLHTKDRPLEFTTTQRVAHILSKGYALGHHFLPHDAAALQKGGKTFATELVEAGLPNIKIVRRTHDIWVGINRLRQLLPRMTFRLPHCGRGIEALQNYHTDNRSNGTLVGEEPIHDWSSHPADALRTFAEADMYGLIKRYGAPGHRRRVPEQVILHRNEPPRQSRRPSSKDSPWALLGL